MSKSVVYKGVNAFGMGYSTASPASRAGITNVQATSASNATWFWFTFKIADILLSTGATSYWNYWEQLRLVKVVVEFLPTQTGFTGIPQVSQTPVVSNLQPPYSFITYDGALINQAIGSSTGPYIGIGGLRGVKTHPVFRPFHRTVIPKQVIVQDAYSGGTTPSFGAIPGRSVKCPWTISPASDAEAGHLLVVFPPQAQNSDWAWQVKTTYWVEARGPIS